MARRAAVVTGTSGTLGAAIASRLLSEGYYVLCQHRSMSATLEKLLSDRGQEGVRAIPIPGDLATSAGVAEAVEEALAVLASQSLDLDVLVNNAGIGAFASIEETSERQLDDLYATNLKGTFLLTQALLRRMNRGGRIVLISSGASRRASGRMAGYAMTKAALNALAIYVAQEAGVRGITCNALGVGPVDTSASATFFGDEYRKREILARTALGRFATPADIANAVALFTSPDSAWITGQYIEVSGGFSL